MKKAQKSPAVDNSTNPMRRYKITKVVLSCGGVDKDLEKAKKLLELLSKRKPQVVASQKRIPTFKVNPGLEVGTSVTIRGEDGIVLLRSLLGAVDNTLKRKQASIGQISFGIKEYIEIPGMEYQRDIGVRGLNVTVVFARPGIRSKIRKIKRAQSIPQKQYVSPEEIIKYMEEQFKTVFK